MIHIVEFLNAMGERDMGAEVLNAHNRLECFCTGLDRDLIEARKPQAPEGMTLVSAEPVAWGVLEWESGEPNPECHAWSFIAGWNELAQEHIKDLIQAQIDSGDRPMKYKAYPLAMINAAKETKC